MDKAGASKLVHFTTDMIYGHTVTFPMTEDHPVAPLGEYGQSKLDTEVLQPSGGRGACRSRCSVRG
jgi:dTDP-glucose 4,6-dehydratase